MEEVRRGHPKGLYVLFVTEMWERFSYYGMRALFGLYLTKALIFNKDVASAIYGSYTGLVYLTPLIGGYIADRYWGNRRSIFVGGILMALGQFMMFASGTVYSSHAISIPLMFAGLGLLIFGNGFFKPNISTMVGQLYKEGDNRVDGAFTIFYMGINLGAFLAPLLCGFVGDTGSPADFKWGFLLAGIGMCISLIVFQSLKNKHLVSHEGVPIGMPPSASSETKKEVKADVGEVTSSSGRNIAAFVVLAVAAVGMWFLFHDIVKTIIVPFGIAAPFWVVSDKGLTKIEKQKIWVIYILMIFVIFFWMAFEQAGISLTFFAEEQTNRMLFGSEVPASYFQSINAVAIVIFAPLFAIIWGWLGKRNREPASPLKLSIGLFLLAVGYLFIALGVKGLDPSVKVSMLWLIMLYLIHTFGELCLSPIGLSLVVKLSPLRFSSLLMGVWFIAVAIGNNFAGNLSGLYPAEFRLNTSYAAKSPDIKDTAIKDTTGQAKIIKADSVYWKGIPFDKKEKEEFKKQYKSDGIKALVAKAESSTWEIVIDSAKNKKGKMEEFVKEIVSVPSATQGKLPEFKFKQIIPAEPDKNFMSGLSKNDSMFYVFKSTGDLEVYELYPVKPSFLGFKIESLYEFFMIFVVLTGIASVILFVLSSKLLKMMHDKR